jgi:hypothetical protein
VDVRDAGAGHVSWIDASGPGETPRYVTSWPEPKTPEPKPIDKRDLERTSATTIEEGAPAVPVDEHPSEPLEKN